MGYWDNSDKKKCAKPWEKFRIFLHGDEAGEVLDDVKQIDKVLKINGYKIILKKLNKEQTK